MYIYIDTYIQYIHTCIHTYIHTYIDTYIHTYIDTYIHTYIHTLLDSMAALCMMFCKIEGSVQICLRTATKICKQNAKPNECTFVINYNWKMMNQSKFEGNTSVTYWFHKGAKLNIRSIGNSSQSTLLEVMQGEGFVTFCLKPKNYVSIVSLKRKKLAFLLLQLSKFLL